MLFYQIHTLQAIHIAAARDYADIIREIIKVDKKAIDVERILNGRKKVIKGSKELVQINM